MKRIKIGNFEAEALIDKHETAWYLCENMHIVSSTIGDYEIIKESKSNIDTPPTYAEFSNYRETLESISMLKPKKITMEF